MAAPSKSASPPQNGEPVGVKISCRNIWKIYGSDPWQFFDAGNGVVDDPQALQQQIQKALPEHGYGAYRHIAYAHAVCVRISR